MCSPSKQACELERKTLLKYQRTVTRWASPNYYRFQTKSPTWDMWSKKNCSNPIHSKVTKKFSRYNVILLPVDTWVCCARGCTISSDTWEGSDCTLTNDSGLMTQTKRWLTTECANCRITIQADSGWIGWMHVLLQHWGMTKTSRPSSSCKQLQQLKRQL